MGHPHGKYLGSIRTIADVRERCVIDGDCWHLRTAHGRPQPKDRVQRIWVHGKGHASATRAIWELAHGIRMSKGRRAVRTCDSYDCANPAHIKALTHSEAQAFLIGRWADMTQPRKVQLARIQRANRRLTAEQLAEIRHGTESAYALAKKFGCSPTTICAARRGETYRDPVSSVWGLAA